MLAVEFNLCLSHPREEGAFGDAGYTLDKVQRERGIAWVTSRISHAHTFRSGSMQEQGDSTTPPAQGQQSCS